MVLQDQQAAERAARRIVFASALEQASLDCHGWSLPTRLPYAQLRVLGST
jgi:hypothetical protein